MSSVSRSVGRPVTRSVLAGQLNNPTQLIKSLFSSNEVGFAYDPNDLTTLYQDAAGTIPVTAAGQPVGLMLDKSKGQTLSDEIFDDSTVAFFGSSTRISPSTYRVYTPDSTASGVTVPVLALNKGWAVVDFEVIRQGGGTFRVDYGAGAAYQIPPNIGRYKLILFCNRGDNSIVFHRGISPTDIEFKIHSIKSIAGNHAYQPTSSMRPLLQNSPRKIDYDAVDDKLIVSLPAQLTGCTVVRAVPNVGTQILTNQTIPTPYNDSTDHCGLIVINRALTTAETAQITQLFNKAAGV